MEQLVIKVNADHKKEPGTHQEWLERGRRWWKTKPSRAIEAEHLIVVDAHSYVVAVGRITGVMKDMEGRSGRVSIEVIPDPESRWRGGQIDRGDSRNPVSYMTEVLERGTGNI